MFTFLNMSDQCCLPFSNTARLFSFRQEPLGHVRPGFLLRDQLGLTERSGGCDYLVMSINFPGRVFVSQILPGLPLVSLRAKEEDTCRHLLRPLPRDICFRCESIEATRKACGLWALRGAASRASSRRAGLGLAACFNNNIGFRRVIARSGY